MDIVDIFENLGLGFGVIAAVVVAILLLIVASRVIPVLFAGLGVILLGILGIAAILFVIYFIGKFAKDFIK